MDILSSTEPIYLCARERLKTLGYEFVHEDSWLMGFVVQKVENYIKSSCNLDEVPEGLFAIEVDMVCGEFLSAKKQSGQLSEFDFEPVVRSISEGDTSVSYATEDTVSQKFDTLLERMAHPNSDEFARYRRVQW